MKLCPLLLLMRFVGHQVAKRGRDGGAWGSGGGEGGKEVVLHVMDKHA